MIVMRLSKASGSSDWIFLRSGRREQHLRLRIELQLRSACDADGYDLSGQQAMWRAIASPTIITLAYWLIIAGEMSAGLLCLAGSIALFRAAPRRRSEFIHAKRAAVAGLTLGIFVWFFGFMTVAAEWFLMWQSQQWNAVQAAFASSCASPSCSST
jgi:hypothetical protein